MEFCTDYAGESATLSQFIEYFRSIGDNETADALSLIEG